MYTLNKKAFEREQQILEYVTSLKQHFLPLKFTYIGRAAYTHNEFVKNKDYSLFNSEAILLKSKFNSYILPELNSNIINLLDIGSGNGLKSSIVIDEIITKGKNIRYCALDYSSELMKIATNNIKLQYPLLDISTHIVDFELSDFKKIIINNFNNSDSQNLFLFLGHTLGNPLNRLVTLTNITNSMNQGDLLIIGVQLYNPSNIKNVLSYYKNEVFLRAVFEPLTFVGLKRNDGLLNIFFDSENKDIKVIFELKKNIIINLYEHGQFNLERFDKILLFVSHRFYTDELYNIANSLRLSLIKVLIEKKDDFVLLITRKI